ADMEDTRVTVVPRGIESEVESRGAHRFEYRVDVATQKRLAAGTNDEIDSMIELTEQIATLFRGNRLTGYPKALCVKVAHDPVYAPEHLEELRQFTGVMTLTFRVTED
ncbi:MAG: hypothetical protein N3A38_12990, partial [Planctomycetota bacterium]|nr:hypothetical protein [Planctomycetota bacterium]